MKWEEYVSDIVIRKARTIQGGSDASYGISHATLAPNETKQQKGRKGKHFKGKTSTLHTGNNTITE